MAFFPSRYLLGASLKNSDPRAFVFLIAFKLNSIVFDLKKSKIIKFSCLCFILKCNFGLLTVVLGPVLGFVFQ